MREGNGEKAYISMTYYRKHFIVIISTEAVEKLVVPCARVWPLKKFYFGNKSV